MDEQVAKRILEGLDEFSEPINTLSERLREISDDTLRRDLLKALGDVMGLLESNIGYKIRKAVRASSGE